MVSWRAMATTITLIGAVVGIAVGVRDLARNDGDVSIFTGDLSALYPDYENEPFVEFLVENRDAVVYIDSSLHFDTNLAYTFGDDLRENCPSLRYILQVEDGLVDRNDFEFNRDSVGLGFPVGNMDLCENIEVIDLEFDRPVREILGGHQHWGTGMFIHQFRGFFLISQLARYQYEPAFRLEMVEVDVELRNRVLERVRN